MTAASLKQPWATPVARGWKPVENRGRRMPVGAGPMAIHASKAYDVGLLLDPDSGRLVSAEEFVAIGLARYGLPVPSFDEMRSWPRGALVGVVRAHPWTTPMLVPEHDRFWAFGPECLPLSEAREFARAIPWPGQIIPFEVPDDVVAGALAA